MTYIISCPVSSATEDYCDGRYDMEIARVARRETEKLAETIAHKRIAERLAD